MNDRDQKALYGRWLRRRREAYGLSMREMAGKLGVTGAAVWSYECGRAYPKREMAVRIAELFEFYDQVFIDGARASQPAEVAP